MKWLKTSQVAARLNVSEKTVYNWLHSGRLDGWKLGKFWMISEDALSALMTPSRRDAGTSGRPRNRNEPKAADPSRDIDALQRFSKLAEGALLNGVSAILDPRYTGPDAGAAVDKALEAAKGEILIAGVGLPEFFNDQGRHAYTIRRMKQMDRPVKLRAVLVNPLGAFASARAMLEAGTDEFSQKNLRVSPLFVSALRSVQVLRSLGSNEDGSNFELYAKFADYWPSVHLVLTDQVCFVEVYHFGLSAEGTSQGRSAPVPVISAAEHSPLYTAMRRHFEYIWNGSNPLIPLHSPQEMESLLQSSRSSFTDTA